MVDEKLENFDSLSDSHSAIWDDEREERNIWIQKYLSLIATEERVNKKEWKEETAEMTGKKSLAQSELRKKIEIEEMRNEKWATAGSWALEWVGRETWKKIYPKLEIFIIFPRQTTRRSRRAHLVRWKIAFEDYQRAQQQQFVRTSGARLVSRCVGQLFCFFFCFFRLPYSLAINHISHTSCSIIRKYKVGTHFLAKVSSFTERCLQLSSCYICFCLIDGDTLTLAW